MTGQASLFPAKTLEEEILDLLENRFGGSPIPFSLLDRKIRERGIDAIPNEIVLAMNSLLRQKKIEIPVVYLASEPSGKQWQFGIVVKSNPPKVLNTRTF